MSVISVVSILVKKYILCKFFFLSKIKKDNDICYLIVFHINSYNKINQQTAVTDTLPTHTKAPRIQNIPTNSAQNFCFLPPVLTIMIKAFTSYIFANSNLAVEAKGNLNYTDDCINDCNLIMSNCIGTSSI